MPKSFEVAKQRVVETLNAKHADEIEDHARFVAMASIAESMTEDKLQAALNRKRKDSDDLKKDVAELIKQEMDAAGGRRTRKRRANRRKKTRRA